MHRVVLAVVVAALFAPAVATAPTKAYADGDAQRALDGYVAMQRNLFDARHDVYRDSVASEGPAHAWPLSQAIAATLAVARVPGASPRIGAAADIRLDRIERLRVGKAYAASPGGDVYWDDNEWLAQDLLAKGDRAGLRRAESIFTAVVGAWDGGSQLCAGGVQWTDAAGNDDRNMVSTVNGALVGLQLYARAHNAATLYWARKMLGWVDQCMLGPDGLYWDHLDGAGNVDSTHWSYNQGSVIGALVLLANETGDTTQIARAEQVADRSLAYFADRWLTAEPPEFAAIFFRNLLALAAVDGRTDYVDAAQQYADDAWNGYRNPRTGLYAFGAPTRLLDQAALVQVYALLATSGR